MAPLLSTLGFVWCEGWEGKWEDGKVFRLEFAKSREMG